MSKITRKEFEELYQQFNEKPFDVFSLMEWYEGLSFEKDIHILVLNKYLTENGYSKNDRGKFDQLVLNFFNSKKKESAITLKSFTKEVVILAGEYVDLVINSKTPIYNSKNDITQLLSDEMKKDEEINIFLSKNKRFKEENDDTKTRKVFLEYSKLEKRKNDLIYNNSSTPLTFYIYVDLFVRNIRNNFKISQNKTLDFLAEILLNIKAITKGRARIHFQENFRKRLSGNRPNMKELKKVLNEQEELRKKYNLFPPH